jgi:ribonuclease HII
VPQLHDNKKADGSTSAFSMVPDFSLEEELAQSGYRYIAGADEAGRGALAGPLAVGIVIYDIISLKDEVEELQRFIRDSKKLTPSAREKSFSLIESKALSYYVSMVSHDVVDQINVNGATETALVEGLKKLQVEPQAVLFDGTFSFNTTIPFFSAKKGDSRSLSIASASIMAKVTRDRYMVEMSSRYPEYSFHTHKGYGTARHREAIDRHGPCPIHRMTFEPVRSLRESRCEG